MLVCGKVAILTEERVNIDEAHIVTTIYSSVVKLGDFVVLQCSHIWRNIEQLCCI